MKLSKGILVVFALLGVLLAGCGNNDSGDGDGSGDGDKISGADLQRIAANALRSKYGRQPDSFTCPDDMPAEVGETTRCVLADDGVRFGATVTIKSVEGNNVTVDVKVDNTRMG